MKKYLIFTLAMIVSFATQAQCAMCRASLENNLANGDLEVGAGINSGIMYLFITPYLALGVVAYFWYKSSRANANAAN